MAYKAFSYHMYAYSDHIENTYISLPLVKNNYYIIRKGQHKCMNLGSIIILKFIFISKKYNFSIA